MLLFYLDFLRSPDALPPSFFFLIYEVLSMSHPSQQEVCIFLELPAFKVRIRSGFSLLFESPCDIEIFNVADRPSSGEVGASTSALIVFFPWRVEETSLYKALEVFFCRDHKRQFCSIL